MASDLRERAREDRLARALVYATEKFGDQFVTAGQFVEALAEHAESEAALARQQEREAYAKAVCEACARSITFSNYAPGILHVTNTGRTLKCRASAIHERNLQEKKG
jgi:hypothetical protein